MDYRVQGCIKDSFDARDKIYENETIIKLTNDTLNIDLNDKHMPIIYDQLSYGSCAANSALRAYEYSYNKWRDKYGVLNDLGGKADCKYSRQFLYYMARFVDSIKGDEGSTIRGNCRALKKWGVCLEEEHKYSLGTEAVPSSNALIHADNNKILSYYRVTSFEGMLYALEQGNPVIIATDVDQFIDADANGFSRKSLSWKERFPGPNHGMLITGRLRDVDYLGTKKNVFIVDNSWGESWGKKGRCYVGDRELWDYNIFDAWVIIEDVGSYLQDREGKEPEYNVDITAKIPNYSIVFGKKGYSRYYLEKLHSTNLVKYKEILSEINENMAICILKEKDGKLKSYNDAMKDFKIFGPVNYVDENGKEYEIK